MIISMLLLIPPLDGIGAALAVNLMLAVGVIYLFWKLYQDLGFSVNRMAASSMLGTSVASGLGLFIMTYIPSEANMMTLLMYIPFGAGIAVAYGLIVFITDRSQIRSDLDILRQAVFS
jgi:peptidoglycan biosynthesis protein MviN/MurJ (putative lipid II flippase)